MPLFSPRPPGLPPSPPSPPHPPHLHNLREVVHVAARLAPRREEGAGLGRLHLAVPHRHAPRHHRLEGEHTHCTIAAAQHSTRSSSQLGVGRQLSHERFETATRCQPASQVGRLPLSVPPSLPHAEHAQSMRRCTLQIPRRARTHGHGKVALGLDAGAEVDEPTALGVYHAAGARKRGQPRQQHPVVRQLPRPPAAAAVAGGQEIEQENHASVPSMERLLTESPCLHQTLQAVRPASPPSPLRPPWNRPPPAPPSPTGTHRSG